MIEVLIMLFLAIIAMCMLITLPSLDEIASQLRRIADLNARFMLANEDIQDWEQRQEYARERLTETKDEKLERERKSWHG